MKIHIIHVFLSLAAWRRHFGCLLLLLLIGSQSYAQENQSKRYLFNEWEVSYGAGSPFGATEWRALKNSVFTQKFSQMWQINFCHQFTADEYGAAPDNYYYPSIGGYFQWLDYSHLRMQGAEPAFPASKTADYGQIMSFGWTLHQYCWAQGKWRAHLNIENGAAYVFSPVYEVGNWVTLSKPWQILVGLGFYLDREYRGGELSLGPQFTHLSNSGLGAYNTGINNFSLCLRYRHKTLKEIQRCRPDQALRNRDESPFHSHFYGSVMAGLGGVYFEYSERPNGQLNVMADVMYRLNPNNGLGLGIDYYHNAQPDRTGRREYVGMGIKYDHWFGPLVIHVQGGAYLNDRRPIKWKGMSRIYENIGFKYVLLRTKSVSPYIGIYTKGNGFNAEQMTFGIGMTFKSVKRRY